MKPLILNKLPQISRFRIIPTKKRQSAAEGILNRVQRKLRVGDEPTIRQLAPFAVYFKIALDEIVVPSLHIESCFEVAFFAKSVMELGFNHHELLLIPSQDVNFVSNASSVKKLAGFCLVAAGLEKLGKKSLKRETGWTEFKERPTKGIPRRRLPLASPQHFESVPIYTVGSHSTFKFTTYMRSDLADCLP